MTDNNETLDGIIYQMDFLAYMNVFFTDRVTYAKIAANVKKDHFFALRRVIAKAYPIQANAINYLGVNEVLMSDMMHAKLVSANMPQWVYIKAAKSEKRKLPFNATDEDFRLLANAVGAEFKEIKAFCIANQDIAKAALSELKQQMQGRI